MTTWFCVLMSPLLTHGVQSAVQIRRQGRLFSVECVSGWRETVGDDRAGGKEGAGKSVKAAWGVDQGEAILSKAALPTACVSS